MMHTKRVWNVGDVKPDDDNADAIHRLAVLLTEHSWTLCTGFRLMGYLYLNDATHEDGAQEYAIVRVSDLRQVETITFGWMDALRAIGYITQISRGYYEQGENADRVSKSPVIHRDQVQDHKTHGRCWHCA